jgi:NTE family protein
MAAASADVALDGVTGIAWETGLIAGLAELDLAAADVIVGTSAGSVVGADLASGQQLEALYQVIVAPVAQGIGAI